MKKNLAITAFLGMLTVILGAFAAHALKDQLEPEALKGIETGILYQMFHVLVLLFVNIHQGFSENLKNKISYLFFGGIFLFSGSIYAIYLLDVAAKSIWFITPMGGLLLILGWGALIKSFLKRP